MKELKTSLLKELEMERDRTAKQKAKYDSLISKYEAISEQYEEIYNELPLSRERKKLKVEFLLKRIQLMQYKVEINDIQQKTQILKQIRGKRMQLEIVKLAQAYMDREASSKRNATLLQEVRTLKDKIKSKMAEKQQLMYIMTKDRANRHIEQVSPSTLIPAFITDIPSLTIPQLQLPSWYSPPKKIPNLKQTSRNTTMCAGGVTYTSISRQTIDTVMTDIGDTSNPVAENQIRGQSNQEMTKSSLTKPMTATQDSSAGKSLEKNTEEELSQAVDESTAPEDNSNEILSCCTAALPGFDNIVAVAMIQPKQKLSSDECKDQPLAVTPAEEQTDHQSSTQAHGDAADTIPVSATHQITANTARPATAEVIDIRAAGVCILEPPIQTGNPGKKLGHNGHYQDPPMDTVNQLVSDKTVLTSKPKRQGEEMKSVPHSLQTYSMYFESSNFDSGNKSFPANTNMECTKKTMQNDMPPSEVQTTRITEDGDTETCAKDGHYLSPIAEETMSGTDQSSEVGKCQEEYHSNTSPVDRCSPISPQADFMMTSPEETYTLKSPSLVISPTIPTTNIDLFGAPSNQQSKTGFTFNFGALNSGTGSVNEVTEKEKASDGFQFNFNNKTSSGSFFKLF